MQNVNNYAEEFLKCELEEREILCCSGMLDKPMEYSVRLLKYPTDKNQYNLLSSNEVDVVFPSPDSCPPYLRDIEIHNRNGNQNKLSICSPHTDPMTYPILYPIGCGGWSTNLKGKFSGKRVTMAS